MRARIPSKHSYRSLVVMERYVPKGRRGGDLGSQSAGLLVETDRRFPHPRAPCVRWTSPNLIATAALEVNSLP